MWSFQSKIFAWVFDYLIAQKQLDGYRMYFAGASSIAGALVIVLEMFAGGHYSDERAAVAFAAFVFGYRTLGEAGKRDKVIEATQMQAVASIASAKSDAKSATAAVVSAEAAKDQAATIAGQTP